MSDMEEMNKKIKTLVFVINLIFYYYFSFYIFLQPLLRGFGGEERGKTLTLKYEVSSTHIYLIRKQQLYLVMFFL